MDKDTTKSTFNEVLNQFPYEKFCSMIKEFGADRYIKKLFTIKMLYLMFIAQISQTESIRELAGNVKNNIDLQDALKLDSISASQLSRRLKETSSSFWGSVFTDVAKVVIQKTTNHLSSTPNVDRVHIIDASTVTLCLNSYLWADYRKTKAGVKLHQCLVYQNGYSYPEKAILTTAKKSDKSQLDELLTTDPNALYVFDRGYVDYKKWDDYCDAGIRFVTRIKDNFITNVIDNKPVDGTNMTESTVILGDPKTTIMRHQLRLIHTVDTTGTPVVILTNDFKMSALEISEIYRSRWKIELFFKWIKQHLKVKKFYGRSANAVYSQIWLALITYCLLLLTKVNLKTKKSLLDIKRLLKDNLFKPFNVFLDLLKRNTTKTSRDRKKKDYNREFEQLLKQIESGTSNFLDTFDVQLNYL
ncbi:IS4 family transposase [Pelotomaculum propionicicum]|uniref:Transposase IS4-like domain-containing protein n=1 Tax=Pelotomaculum propionicicum TaxID=258475 RepID=A0A4Y7RPV2_9FIRM|nr:IS4 family transposase [Pelotomaculum propionicicum]TEB11044.1 hypothetical protein Pmgp_01916 [Pelotomaculum propionicicum]